MQLNDQEFQLMVQVHKYKYKYKDINKDKNERKGNVAHFDYTESK